MRAVRLLGPAGPVVVAEAPLPEPGLGEVRLRTQACGLCHSDLFVCSLPELPRTPLTLGHEAIGTVDALGPGVENLEPGDRVGLTYLFDSCRNCEFCLSDHRELCSRQVNTGYHVDGAFAEYALGRANYLARVPVDLPPEQAAPLCCAGWTAYRAVRSTELEPGSWIAIFGVGGLGHLAIQFARLQGLRVAAVDVSPEKLTMAKKLGAELTIDANSDDPAKRLRKAVGRAHAAISFVASASVIQQAFGSLRRRGLLVLVGLAAQKFELPLVETVIKQIRIHGSFLGSPSELAEVFEIARRGELQFETEGCSLDELPAAMERMKAGEVSGRAVVTFP